MKKTHKFGEKRTSLEKQTPLKKKKQNPLKKTKTPLKKTKPL